MRGTIIIDDEEGSIESWHDEELVGISIIAFCVLAGGVWAVRRRFAIERGSAVLIRGPILSTM